MIGLTVLSESSTLVIDNLNNLNYKYNHKNLEPEIKLN